LNGERSPFHDPFARGAFIGLSAAHTRADLVRAVLEGVVYAYRHALETLVGDPVASLTLTGGGTRSAAWSQLFADALGLPVEVAEDAGNVGVRGAVIAARVAAGTLDGYAPDGFFPVAARYDPRTNTRDHHARQFGRFKQAYPALKGLFASADG
jgi:sugar (pentulose or hexulose) kinase